MSKTHIDLDYLDKPPIHFDNPKANPLTITQGDKFARRVFNNSSWDKGGRFYGGWKWCRLPSKSESVIERIG
jgi:hypothetical protein